MSPRTIKPAVNGHSPDTLAVSLNHFSEVLVKAMLKHETGNFLVSPLGVYTVLAMLLGGAKGKTLTQLKEVLGIGESEFAHTGELLKLVTNAEDVASSNQGWVGENTQLLVPFKKFLATLGTELVRLNFTERHTAASEINRWADKATDGMIQKIIDPNDISPALALILANALLFKGQWKHPFNKAYTAPRDFTLHDGTTVKALSMVHEDNFKVGESTTYRAILLPYETGSSMVVVLPKKTGALNTILANLKVEKLIGVLNGGTVAQTVLHLPKWNQSGSYDLRPVLKSMGLGILMEEPSSARKVACDLSGITGTRDLYVGRFKQDTRLEVDELETKFAAVTHTGIMRASFVPSRREFIVNQPFGVFLFSANGVLLGTSRVVDPRG